MLGVDETHRQALPNMPLRKKPLQLPSAKGWCRQKVEDGDDTVTVLSESHQSTAAVEGYVAMDGHRTSFVASVKGPRLVKRVSQRTVSVDVVLGEVFGGLRRAMAF